MRVPSVDWRTAQIQQFIPFLNDPRGPAVKQISPREWESPRRIVGKTSPAPNPSWYRRGETAPSAGFSFLLRGSADFTERAGEDSTACVSQVTNIHLTINYTVFPDNGGFIPPR